MGEIADALRRAQARYQIPTQRSLAEEGSETLGFESEEEREAPAQQVTISNRREGAWRHRALLVEEGVPAAESYRHFAIRLLALLAERKLRTLAISSAGPQEGKTTTVCNLAMALTSTAPRQRIALVDLDLRRASVAAELAIEPVIGIERVLAGETTVASARIATQFRGLDLYLAGSPSAKALELMTAPALASLVRQLSRRYHLVVFDTPPLLLLPDVLLLLREVDACVAVARVGVTRRRAFEQMLEALPADKLLGFFVNEAPTALHSHQYRRYYDDRAAGGTK